MDRRNLALLFVKFLAIVFVMLAIAGGIRGYSPVPQTDMWNGYLEFYTKVEGGDFSAWWAQHNEHRIVLSRALFWVDLAWFHGNGLFLLVVNYVLVGLSCLLFGLMLKERISSIADTSIQSFFYFFICALLFSWIQSENILGAFQSMFFLGQLLPLLAFFLLHKAHVSKVRSNTYFVLSCVAGVAAAGNLANGVLALPLMTVLALLLRQGLRRVVVVVFLSLFVIAAYFNDYQSPSHHGSLKDTLLHHPGELLQYVLLYIGGPFYFLTGSGSVVVAKLAGVFLIVSALVFAAYSIRRAKESSLQLSLLAFLLFIGGTAVGTGGARLIFGAGQSFASRYQTPALMAWTALLILFAPVLVQAIRRHPIRIPMIATAILLILLPHQLQALRSQQEKLFGRKVAALALELGVNDREQIGLIFPFVDWARSIGSNAAASNLSIFGISPIKDAKQLFGHIASISTEELCVGSLDEVSIIPNETQYLAIRGWLYRDDVSTVPESIQVLDEDRRVVGYAVVGQPRPDIKATIGGKAENSGFKGYLLTDSLGTFVTLMGDGTNCALRASTVVKIE